MLLEILKFILGIAPFVAFCFFNSKINLSKPKRVKQFLMPIISLAYCIVAVFFLDTISGWVLGFIYWLTKYLPFIANWNIELLLIYLVNVALVLGHMVLKGIVLPVLSLAWSSHAVLNATASWIYDYDADLDQWFVNRKFSNFRSFCKGIYWALLTASSCLLMLSLYHPSFPAFKAILYPFFGILILSEVVHFLSGMTKQEFVEEILGEDEESFQVANYGMLRKILRDLYEDRVIYDNTTDSTGDLSDTFDSLTEMSESDDRLNRMMSEYFLALKQGGEEIDINYVKQCINMLKGNSVLFGNPFYRDLTHYTMVPMTMQLMRYRKCLIVVGRDSTASDVEEWINDAVVSFTGTKSLWKVGILDDNAVQVDIGILKFSDIYNLKIHQVNRDFLKDVGFFMIVEPSRILASGQIGLNLLVNECESEEKKIVYCACDRNCDGLVDALSHTLKTSITEVTASLAGGANSSHMYWNADGKYMHHKIFPNVSRYLGMGTEINAIALKYQLKNTGWIGSEKFPVSDMKWIAGQYYKEICNFTNLPISQDAFNRNFRVESNLWKWEKRDNMFLVVEDEFQNLFEVTRTFASRARQQSFINVISENYFLRDYMVDNVEVFLADPKAIPTIVPDYARTERNMVLKLLMLMVHKHVSEEQIEKELMLCGIQFENAYDTLRNLIIKHCDVEDVTLSVVFREKVLSDSLSTATMKYYAITEANELYHYAQSLRNAYYIAEDEEGDKHHIGAKLYGHVFQALLPGQFMTHDGKYYEVETITPKNGVVVRRASEHIHGRKYYRQLRSISLENYTEGTEMGCKKSISGIEITQGFANICVNTEGYLEMDSYGDFKRAKKVLINGIPERRYKNKSILKIKLPEMSEKVRGTICLLLNEVFRTTYPTAYHYISAVCPSIEDSLGVLKDTSYTFAGECEPDCFYIVEDSDIDLGLIVSVERNLKRYLEIVTDVLMWHTEKMQEPAEEEPAEDAEVSDEEIAEGTLEPEKKKGIFGRIKDFFGRLFGKKKKQEEQAPGETASEPVAEGEAIPPEKTKEPDELATGEEPTAETPGFEEGAEEQLPAPESAEEASASEEPKKKVGFFGKIKAFFKKLFGKKSKKQDEAVPEAPVVPEQILNPESAEGEAVVPISVSDDALAPVESAEEISDEQTGEVVLQSVSGKAIPQSAEETEEEPSVATEEGSDESEVEADIAGEDEELSDGTVAGTDYQNKCFLKFGYETFSDGLDIEGTIAYLCKFGLDNNPLKQVRDGADFDAEQYDPKKYGAHLCDFCGVELLGGEYEVLKDGRERCNRCSMTAIKTVEGFKEVYKAVIRNMEIFYNVRINTAIKVRTTDAKKIAKHAGEKFVATPGFDCRVLGFAKKDKTGYSIYVENGSPRLAAISTIAHELTHIWQYLNWNDADIKKKYGGKEASLEIYEGMAKWAEIQFLILLGEKQYAKRQEIVTRARDDVYGKGFIRFCEKYPLSYHTNLSHTPFEQNPPL